MSMHAREEIVKQIERERESSTIAELTNKLNDAMQIRAVITPNGSSAKRK